MPLACLIAAILGMPAGFTEAPVYVRLFTPRGAPPGAYRTVTSTQDLDTLLAALRRDPSFIPAAGAPALRAESVVAADAFGLSGAYNRWQLALLYGAKRARVARGPRVENGRVIEAWTLVSPYPDPDLKRLNAGTLVIILNLNELR
jgi:hypothetical protein